MTKEDVVPRHWWRLGVVLELLKGSDGYSIISDRGTLE